MNAVCLFVSLLQLVVIAMRETEVADWSEIPSAEPLAGNELKI